VCQTLANFECKALVNPVARKPTPVRALMACSYNLFTPNGFAFCQTDQSLRVDKSPLQVVIAAPEMCNNESK